jgi:hypothetical protein
MVTSSPPSELDLGAVATLQSVNLFNRTDCCSTRLNNFYVLVSQTSMDGQSLSQLLANPAVTARYVATSGLVAGNSPQELTVDVGGVSGRYVRVQLVGTNQLALAEVQVMGRPAAPGFSLSVSPSSVELQHGGATGNIATVALTPQSGFTGAVTFSLSGTPPSLNYAFLPASSTTGTTLVLYASAAVAPGTYPVTLTGTSGSTTTTTMVTLVIQ